MSHNYRATVCGSDAPEVEGPRAGDRAPDAQLVVEPRKRLFDLFRHCGFTLLLVPRAGNAEDVELAARVAERMRAAFGDRVSSVLVTDERTADFDEDHTIPDQLGELARRYAISAGEGRAILVRPDMYVGGHCRIEDAESLVGQVVSWLTPRLPVPASAR